MRSTTAVKSVLSATAALALLTACGGGSDEPAASSSSSSSSAATSSSAAETSEAPDADAAAFCSDAEAAFSQLEGIEQTTDLTTIPAQFAEVSSALSAIEPPAEIAESWTTVTGSLEQVVQSIQGLDLTTPEGQQAFSEAFSTLDTTATAEQDEVEAYLTANCDTAATPTS